MYYGERTAAQPLRISLDGVNNDGESGEGDNVTSDVEEVIGGAGNDRIIGSSAANAISSGDGDDVIIGGGGGNVIVAGDGNDVVEARDGVQDSIDCGPGSDTAIVDELDIVSGCETVQASREFQSDVDADGVAAPADCNDRDPSIRPGAEDVPHNGIDEDCSGADTILPIARGSVVYAFRTTRGVTRVIKLDIVRAVAGTRVEMKCKGSRCPFKTKSLRVTQSSSRLRLAKYFKGRAQRSRGLVEIRVIEPERQGRVVRFRMRSKLAPSRSQRCLPPGATRPVFCP